LRERPDITNPNNPLGALINNTAVQKTACFLLCLAVDGPEEYAAMGLSKVATKIVPGAVVTGYMSGKVGLNATVGILKASMWIDKAIVPAMSVYTALWIPGCATLCGISPPCPANPVSTNPPWTPGNPQKTGNPPYPVP
jgi:hypothetical protein